MAKPFLKWAGGKTQLLSEISNNLPSKLSTTKFTYIEPFIGSGSVMFWFIQQFPNTLEKIVINDINEDLINTYKVIASDPKELIELLKGYETEYHALVHESEEKKEYYYDKRSIYNTRKSDKITQAGLFIFLNRTCFNGLYRVNRKNEFNVPIGSYKAPRICDEENLLAVSEALQKVEILIGDYQQTLSHAEGLTFFYFDPPYKPLDETSNFNSYAKDEFNDVEQIRLRDFCKTIEEQGYLWMLSNSDVRGKNPDNLFFDILYQDFTIQRVDARRNINSKSHKRGILSELLINNYNVL